MKKNQYSIVFIFIFSSVFLFVSNISSAQYKNNSIKFKNAFWEKVQFGGGLGLGFGSEYTDISVSPSAIYNINKIVSVGIGLQLGYLSSKNQYTSFVYGGSLIGLVNPTPQIQLSAELEQIRVNINYYRSTFSNNYWNTALYFGAGYRTGNVTVGMRYDVLYNKETSFYGSGFMPFVRIYF